MLPPCLYSYVTVLENRYLNIQYIGISVCVFLWLDNAVRFFVSESEGGEVLFVYVCLTLKMLQLTIRHSLHALGVGRGREGVTLIFVWIRACDAELGSSVFSSLLLPTSATATSRAWASCAQPSGAQSLPLPATWGPGAERARWRRLTAASPWTTMAKNQKDRNSWGE